MSHLTSRRIMAALVGLFLVSCPIGSACAKPAQERAKEYAAGGGPAEPRVEVRWNRFRDYQAATDLLKELARAYPDLCRLKSLGKSHGGRDMWVMTVTDFATGNASRKPAMWIDGGIHANEIQSVEVVLYTAWYLLEMADENEQIAQLLRERTFYLSPMLSPDSRDAHFREPNSAHTPRTGQRPVDDDRDGLVDEDGPDDLNDDGHITRMRVADANGTYKSHPKYPNVMIPVERGERGEYRLLGTEGIDNDDDGKVNEDGDGSYDPNRDWPWKWQPGHIQRGAHRYPLAIKENRLIADFIKTRPNIVAGQSYHNAGGMLLRGPGAKSDKFERGDIAVYDHLAKQGEEILPGYRYLNIANELYEVHGGSIDWMHQMRGAYVFTNEMFTPFNYFRRHSEGGFFGSIEDRQQFNKYLLLDGATAPWQEVDHPTYGKIEVGGMKKNWMRQPPGFLIEEELHRNMAFTLYHASEMPQVKIESISTRDLEDGLTEVTAAIRNDKLIPTHSGADLKFKLTRPDWVSIEGDKVKVLLGMWSNEPFFKSPHDQKRRPQRMEIPRIDGHSVVFVRWIVRGKGPYRVAIDSVKGGADKQRFPADEVDES